MNQLRKMFYEECRENSEVLETILLDLDPDNVGLETINTIFRAAHSIKGGAATFNLLDISEFTHNVEVYLDEVNKALAALLDTQGDTNADSSAPPSEQVESTDSGNGSDTAKWLVSFIPHTDLFFSGNDPLRIIGEIKELDSDCDIVCNMANLPELSELEPELCYLNLRMTISGEVTEEDIREIFEWVEDQCDLDLQREQTEGENAAQPSSETEQTETVPQEPQPQSASVPVPETKPKDNKKPAAAGKPTKSESSVSYIRVDIDKVDSLINLVGELVITQSMLTEIGNDFTVDKLEKLKSGLDQLLQNSKDLQENVLNIRMLPMSFAFSRFPRLVRDLSGRLGKQVDLQIKAENTELDKTVLERIVDPLVHLVRNGLELPDERRENGKPEMGVIELNAFHQGGSIIIEVKDDGAGINCDKLWKKSTGQRRVAT
jgi:two-component system chemotaxis sensor kinase CheA